MRRGYSAEYSVKQKLVKEFGKLNVIKMPFWNFIGDFLVVQKGRIVKIVEVKTSKSKWYPTRREKEQFNSIKKFCDEHSIRGEYHITENKKHKILTLDEVSEKFFKNYSK